MQTTVKGRPIPHSRQQTQCSCSFDLFGLFPSLFSKMREKEGMELWAGRKIGRGKHNQNILCGGKLFSIKNQIKPRTQGHLLKYGVYIEFFFFNLLHEMPSPFCFRQFLFESNCMKLTWDTDFSSTWS